MEIGLEAQFLCCGSIGTCTLISVLYVASLYVWRSKYDRNHPSTIKRRFISVTVMMFISPALFYLAIDKEILKKKPLWILLGIRTDGLLQAILMPLFLTMILFLGPISVQFFSGLYKMYSDPNYWLMEVRSLQWIRNHIAAPLTEEFNFRSCMLPLLLQCFEPTVAVFVCALFFGIVHFHHMVEMTTHKGIDLKNAFLLGCFSFAFTILFGAYSSFLFLRTGHLASMVVVHTFCNHMGFPNFGEVLSFHSWKRYLLCILYVVGLVAWCCLLQPLTEPRWYLYHSSSNCSAKPQQRSLSSCILFRNARLLDLRRAAAATAPVLPVAAAKRSDGDMQGVELKLLLRSHWSSMRSNS